MPVDKTAGCDKVMLQRATVNPATAWPMHTTRVHHCRDATEVPA